MHFNSDWSSKLGSVKVDGKRCREYRWALNPLIPESATDVRMNALMLWEIDPRKKDCDG